MEITLNVHGEYFIDRVQYTELSICTELSPYSIDLYTCISIYLMVFLMLYEFVTILIIFHIRDI